jgi:MFS superfamily sulfate permease-like transporter
LGAIVISAVIGFLNVPALRHIYQLRRGSFWLAMVALFGVLILGMLPGLLLAVLLSALLLLVRISKPNATELGQLPDGNEYANLAGARGAQAVPGLVILRLDAPLIAFNAQSARNLIRERVRAAQPKPQVVLFDMEMSADLDVGSIDKLGQIHRELAEDGVQLWLARPHGEAERMLYHAGLDKVIGADRIFHTVGEGVAAFEAQHRT